MLILKPLQKLVLAAALTTLAPLVLSAQTAPPTADLGKNYEGDKISLNDYAGKVVVISFWASWCKYCLKELPILSNIQTLGKKEHLAVIAINIEERKTFRTFAKQLEVLGLTLTNDSTNDIKKAYAVGGIPHLVIINRKGQIVNVYAGYGEEMLDGIANDLNLALAANE